VRRAIVGLLVLGALVVGGCAAADGGVTADATEPPGPHLTVVAKDIAFDTAQLSMTAGQPTQIYFVNQDDAPHDIQIAATKDGGGPMFEGDIINKGAIVYSVPGFGAGSYYFRCTVHPNMNGTVVVDP
jgi:plastocyanin